MKWILALAIAAPAAAGQRAEMSARQLFYDEGKPVAQVKKTTPPTKSTPKKPVAIDDANPPHVSQPEPVPVVAASYSPLAIRYSLAKIEDGAEVEVPSSQVFHSGDQVRVKVQANQRGYLYLVARGSSGIWKPLFPSRQASDNIVDARRVYDVPSSTMAFTFDEQAGKEQLFLLFSRTPVNDLDALIDNLRNRVPAPPTRAEVTLAQNLTDTKVDGLRKMYARDLIIETVNSKKPASPNRPAEAAVYVANASGNPDSRIVADIELTHLAK